MLNKKTIEKINKILHESTKIINFTSQLKMCESQENGHSYAQEWQNILLEEVSRCFPENVFIEDKANKYIKYSEKQEGCKLKERSFGDFYFLENGYYNPIDAKLNASTKNGQPNTSAMMRQLKAWEKNIIDSFYIIKLKVSEGKILFYDMYDYFHYLTYNMGTGQIMTKESDFNITKPAVLTQKQKKESLIKLYEKQAREHIELKQKQLQENINQFKKII